MRAFAVVAALVAHVASGATGAAAAVAAAPPEVNDRPIVGILTLPNHMSEYSHLGTSYFPASYVKWVESGGGRVVPIPYDAGAANISRLARSVNAVLFTGGGTSIVKDGKLTTFGLAGQQLYDAVVEANKAGEYMPLWATCLGFEMLHVLASGDPAVLTGGFDSENISLALDLTPAAGSSRLLGAGSAPSNVVDILSGQAVTMNNHMSGITPDAFAGNANLTAKLTVLSTNKDRKGRSFVSTVEGKDMPIYASQWHPEKVQFEWWSREVIDHSSDAVTANSYPVRFLLSEARRNSRHFSSEQAETEALIYNYRSTFTGPTLHEFVECYFF